MKTKRISYLLDVDSYKSSHYLQYPPGTTSMYSYVESRGGKFPKSVFFGLQYALKEYLSHRVTKEEVEFAKNFMEKHGEPFNYDGWMHIVNEHDGKLPVRIRAVPEGTVLPNLNIMASIESTDPKAFWAVSWIETLLLRYIWYGTTVATTSYFVKQDILNYLNMTADKPEDEIGFKLHDFGSRGVSSQESAMLGGAAHLVNFLGTDTIAGVLCANQYYNCDMAGFSIPATEHSSMTAWGKEGEADAFRNVLKQFAKPGSLVACVSDSYDIFNACENVWGSELKQEVIDSGATLVIRPDSGEPTDVVLKCLEILGEKFGFTENTKGYKVLNHVKLIQGDGVSPGKIHEIMDAMTFKGWSVSNIAFGMGGGLLQKLNRDTLRFALKCSHITRDGKSVDVYKDPVTDKKKISKAGRLELIKTSDGFKTIKADNLGRYRSSLRTVFKNGEILIEDSFDKIRERASQP